MRVTILAHLCESPKFFQTAVKVHLWVKVLWSGFKRMTNVQSVCHVPHKTWYCFRFVKAAECQRGFLLVQVSPSPELVHIPDQNSMSSWHAFQSDEVQSIKKIHRMLFPLWLSTLLRLCHYFALVQQYY